MRQETQVEGEVPRNGTLYLQKPTRKGGSLVWTVRNVAAFCRVLTTIGR